MPFRVTRTLELPAHCLHKSMYILIMVLRKIFLKRKCSDYRPHRYPRRNGTKLPQMTGSIGTRLGRQFYDIFIAASAPPVLPAVGPQGWGDVWDEVFYDRTGCFSPDRYSSWFPRSGAYLQWCIKWCQSWALSTEEASPKISAIYFETIVHPFIQQIFIGLLLCARHCFRSWRTKQIRFSIAGNFDSSLIPVITVPCIEYLHEGVCRYFLLFV